MTSLEYATIVTVVRAGAECETRTADGTPLGLWTLNPEVAELEWDDDGLAMLLLQPLPDGIRQASSHDQIDPSAIRLRPFTAARIDLLGNGHVGFAHPSGAYSLIRPAGPYATEILSHWRQIQHGQVTL